MVLMKIFMELEVKKMETNKDFPDSDFIFDARITMILKIIDLR